MCTHMYVCIYGVSTKLKLIREMILSRKCRNSLMFINRNVS